MSAIRQLFPKFLALNNGQLLGFNIGLALLTYLHPLFLFIVFFLLGLSFFSQKKDGYLKQLPYFLGLLILIELWGRILNLSPWAPYESGKYIGAIVLIYGIYLVPNKQWKDPVLLLLILSLPGLLIGVLNNGIQYSSMVFNYGGLFVSFIAIYFFSNYSISRKEVLKLFRFLGFSGTGLVFFFFINQPQIHLLEYRIIGNNLVIGGFNPNQVSTALSTFFSLSLFWWAFTDKHSWASIINAVILIFWSFLCFSRGGIFVAIFALFLIGIANSILDSEKRPKWLIFTCILILSSTFWLTNTITDGQLLRRYQGETSRMEYGIDTVKNLNTYTSYRALLIESDLAIWKANPILGVGVGQSSVIRKRQNQIVYMTHTEHSRLLSEHGIAGLIIGLFLILGPLFRLWKAWPNPFWFSFFLLCFLLAFGNSLHSAMRTFVTPFFYGLAFVRFNKNKDIAD